MDSVICNILSISTCVANDVILSPSYLETGTSPQNRFLSWCPVIADFPGNNIMSQTGNKKNCFYSYFFLFYLSKYYILPSIRREINKLVRTWLGRKSIVFRFVLPPLSLILSQNLKFFSMQFPSIVCKVQKSEIQAISATRKSDLSIRNY